MLDRRKKRQIEWNFFNYEANRKLGAELLREIAESGTTVSYDRVGFGSDVGNPTESKALRYMTKAQPYYWAKVVENTMTAFRFEPVYDILVARYIDKRNHRDILKDYFGSERSYYYTLDRALGYAYMWAKEYGIL